MKKPRLCKYPDCQEYVYQDCVLDGYLIDEAKEQDMFDRSLEAVDPRTAKVRRYQSRYQQTDKGKERQKKYNKSQKGIEARRRYEERRKERRNYESCIV